MAMMRFQVDQDDESGCSYVKVGEGRIAETLTFGLVNVDLDTEGRTVGVEFFGHLVIVEP